MNEQHPPRRPRVVLTIASRPGRARAAADMSGPEGAVQAVPDLPPGGTVRVTIGTGLQPEDVPALAVLAQRVRHAAVVELVGAHHEALRAARAALLAAWDLDVPQVPEGAPQAAAWAAVMLARPWQGTRGA